jgi:RNA polymerase sigma-70 factor (ECF subfamily)
MTSQLYKSYSDNVCHYLNKRVDRKEIACDLMQDTFQKVLDNEKKLEKVRNPKAWIFRIAHNTLIDYTRKKKEDSLNDLQIPSEENTHEDTTDLEIISQCLYELIEEYSDDEQEILLDVFTKSLSQKEAAKHLDIPYSTFKSRVQKAREVILFEFEERCCHLKYDKQGHIIGCNPVR